VSFSSSSFTRRRSTSSWARAGRRAIDAPTHRVLELRLQLLAVLPQLSGHLGEELVGVVRG